MLTASISAIVTIEAMGARSDWATASGSNVNWSDDVEPDGGLVFDGAPEGESASLQGCSAAALDAMIPEGSECRVLLVNPSDGGTINVTIRDGDPVAFTFPHGGSEIEHTVIAGPGSGVSLIAGDDSPQSHIGRVRIEVRS